MYEKFTDLARKVLSFANKEANQRGCRLIETEHILLGLIKIGEGIAFCVIKNMIGDLLKIEEKINLITRIAPDTEVSARLLQAPSAQKVVDYAIQEARKLGHNYIGTEHILLGLLCEEKGVAACVLKDFGLSVETVRKEIINFLEKTEPEVKSRVKEKNSQPTVKAKYKGIEVKKENGTSFGQFIDSLNKADANGWQEIVMVTTNRTSFFAVLRRPD
jgi:ATP-dependent Clp protease ATP-binding subunit ClpC